MVFAALDSENGVEILNTFLADNSYIDGYQVSVADKVVLEALKTELVKGAKFAHVARWIKHIKSFTGDAFKGKAKSLAEYGPAAKQAAKDEDDIDLFGSDDDDDVDEAAEKLKQQRLAEYNAKKANKPKTIAKSSLLLNVKPWDDETDMKEMEAGVRAIEMDGLIWGTSKLVPVGYGIKMLQISCVVEDDKVSTDELDERITALSDHVQSMDIAAFNKI